MNKISSIINEICRAKNINYQSKFLDETHNNAVAKLANIYVQLKQIMATLSEIEENHRDVRGLVKVFEGTISRLNQIDHIIIKEAIILSKEHGK